MPSSDSLKTVLFCKTCAYDAASSFCNAVAMKRSPFSDGQTLFSGLHRLTVSIENASTTKWRPLKTPLFMTWPAVKMSNCSLQLVKKTDLSAAVESVLLELLLKTSLLFLQLCTFTLLREFRGAWNHNGTIFGGRKKSARFLSRTFGKMARLICAGLTDRENLPKLARLHSSVRNHLEHS